MEAILGCLTDKLTFEQLLQSSGTQKRFYLVNHDFRRLRDSMSPARDALAKSVDAFSMPPMSALTSLCEKEALCLQDVIKSALSLQISCNRGDLRAKTYFGMEDGNPFQRKIVVPVMRLAQPGLIEDTCEQFGLNDDGFNTFLKPHGRKVVMGFFASYLAKGHTAGEGGRLGGYLLTEITARLIHQYYLARASDDDAMTLDEMFPNLPKMFPGNGLYCVPLPFRVGNFLA